MTSLAYLRGEREVKVRANTDRRMLGSKIKELSEQTKLNVIEEITFECISERTREFAKRVNQHTNAQTLIDECKQ